MELIAALIAGASIGAVLGFIGAGGAMLSVPILIYGFGFDAKSATTAALVIVGLAALSGLIPKARKGEVLYRDALVIVGLGLVTNLGFASLASRIPDSIITIGFAGVLILAGLSMLRSPKFSEQMKMPISILIIISLVIGSITGLFGIGGGFLAIPVLVLYFGTPPSIAAGTSLLIIALNSLISFLGRNQIWENVQWDIPIVMAIAAILFAQVASRLSGKSSPAALRKAFAYLLLAISAFTLIQSWIAL